MRTYRNRHQSHEQYEPDDCYQTYTITKSKSYNVIKATKHYSSLYEEDYDEYDGHNGYDEYAEQHTHSNHHKRNKKSFVRQACNEVFKCKNCRRFISPPPSGGHQRNHCPFCLYSLHVDGETSGDRLSTCGSRMEPIGHFQRFKGEYVLVHRCKGCGFERYNRIAADDNFDLVLALPTLAPRTKRV
ncbi:MAG TPA: RNHCP domain protein [Ktedonobacter sp.]|nr:RNHCP domain protein [Ktedonobacter sp.]